MLAAQRIEKPHVLQNGNGSSKNLQNSLHLPDKVPLWNRIFERLKKHGVVTKNEGKYTISQPLALVIIGVMLTAFYAYYSRSSDKMDQQREEIIILRTQLKMEQEKNIDQDSKIDQARATAQVATTTAARLEGKFDQFSAQVYTGKKKLNPDLEGEN